MKEKLIKKMVTDALQLGEGAVTDIRRTPGGLTNKSYFATIDGEKYVVRISGSGAEKLVNRQDEKENLLFGTKLGLNPATLYFNVNNGFKITRKIEGAIPTTPTLAREGNTMKQIIQLFKRLHKAKTPMKNDFKLFDLMRHYESLVNDVNDITTEKVSKLKKDVDALQSVYESLRVSFVPCHIDPDYSNIIKSENGRIYLIDWEYSGMFDPLWDMATLFLSLELNKEELLFFLTQYLERKPNEEEFQRILLHVIFQDYLWVLWSIFKEFQGDDVGYDVVRRFDRATKNITLYKKTFEEDIVV